MNENTNDNNLEQDVSNILAKYPDLSLFGFWQPIRVHGTDFLDQVATVRSWLSVSSENAHNIATQSSYEIKQLVEQSCGRLLSNAAVIVGTLLEGYTPLLKYADQNCLFQPADHHSRKPEE